jgi:hypothetical protein
MSFEEHTPEQRRQARQFFGWLSVKDPLPAQDLRIKWRRLGVAAAVIAVFMALAVMAVEAYLARWRMGRRGGDRCRTAAPFESGPDARRARLASRRSTPSAAP